MKINLEREMILWVRWNLGEKEEISLFKISNPPIRLREKESPKDSASAFQLRNPVATRHESDGKEDAERRKNNNVATDLQTK